MFLISINFLIFYLLFILRFLCFWDVRWKCVCHHCLCGETRRWSSYLTVRRSPSRHSEGTDVVKKHDSPKSRLSTTSVPLFWGVLSSSERITSLQRTYNYLPWGTPPTPNSHYPRGGWWPLPTAKAFGWARDLSPVKRQVSSERAQLES